jgi:uncharacterized protein
MHRILRYFTARISVALWALLFFAPVFPHAAIYSQDPAGNSLDQYQPRGYVNDFAGIIDAKPHAELEEFCKRLDQNTQTQMAVVTVVSLQGMDIKDFATQLFNRWGVGHKDTNLGGLVLLSKQDHLYRIAVSRGIESTLTDEKCDRLGKEMVPMLRKNEYGNALLQLAHRIAAEIQPQIPAR